MWSWRFPDLVTLCLILLIICFSCLVFSLISLSWLVSAVFVPGSLIGPRCVRVHTACGFLCSLSERLFLFIIPVFVRLVQERNSIVYWITFLDFRFLGDKGSETLKHTKHLCQNNLKPSPLWLLLPFCYLYNSRMLFCETVMQMSPYYARLSVIMILTCFGEILLQTRPEKWVRLLETAGCDDPTGWSVCFSKVFIFSLPNDVYLN